MASGGGGGGGAGVCINNKRSRGSADDDGETSGRNKRCGFGPSSVASDDGKSGDGGDVYGGHARKATDDEEDGGGEDYMYGSDDFYDDDEEAEQSKGGAAAPACDSDSDTEPRYVVLTEDDVRVRQAADTATVAEILSIPAGFAAVLLRHFKWSAARVQEEWFTDDRRVRRAVGLPAPADDGGDGGELVLAPNTRSRRPEVCGICFDLYSSGETRSAACAAHYYCDGCWRGYVAAAVRDGARCLSLRCPDPSCAAPVVRELVDAVLAAARAAADADVRARYDRFWLRSYVEESGGRVKWCGGAGCTRSIEFLAAGDAAAADVFCGGCRHGFCWGCGEEAHGPVTCGTVRAWLAKNASDCESAKWVVAHTKRCPKCRRPIEKSHGCNHMTCGAPCRHEFCWLCFDPWYNHRGCSRYDYRHRQQAAAAADDDDKEEEEEARRREAKASLDRYLYHYERWEGNGKSLQKALADADELERWELERMARMVDLPAMELAFVTEAYRQIADGRRVLRWAHAYAYFLFLDPERDVAKRELFDDLQSQANRWLEALHGCAELERKELFGGDDGGGEPTVVDAAAFRKYKEKVANLTGVTHKFMGNLVKAFKEKAAFGSDRIENGPTMGRQTTGVGGIISTATVTLEPAAMLPIVSGPAGFWHLTPSIPNAASQGMSTLEPSSLPSLISQEANVIANGSVHEHRPMGYSVQQPLHPGGHGRLHSNLSQFPQINSTFLGEATTSMRLPNMGTITPLQYDMSNTITRGAIATPPPVTFSMSGPGQQIGTEEMVQSRPLGSFGSNASAAWGNSDNAASSSQHNSMTMDRQAGINPLSSAMNAPIGLHPNAQQPPPKYVKIWEGTLSGQRQGQPVFICKLESYRGGTVSETVAARWPENMQIVRLISQEHMNKKQYVEKADILIFRTLNQHGFLGQLQDKKLCAVVQLPSQTLLLSMSEKQGRLIGMLFPENMVVFKPEVLTQPSPVQQENLQGQQELLHLHQQSHQTVQPLQQQILQQQQLMQQMQHQQQHQRAPRNLLIQQQMLQQQLQHQEQLHFQQQLMQQQQPQYQQQVWQQMQHQMRQQIQQHMQQIRPQLPLLPQMMGAELGDDDDDASEDWVTGSMPRESREG